MTIPYPSLDLASKTSPGTHTGDKVHAALRAAVRLAEECDKSQKFDVDQLRRLEMADSASVSCSWGGGGRKEKKERKKARPLSMGI